MNHDDPSLTASTPLLDYHHPALQTLIAKRGWMALDEYHCIGSIYDFVRNEILFGYNEDDTLPASRVLADGMGQCNTKTTLLMALLRATGIACRFHGFTIDMGVFADPDAFYARHGANLSGIKRWLYRHFIRHWMNRNVARIRNALQRSGALASACTQGDH